MGFARIFYRKYKNNITKISGLKNNNKYLIFLLLHCLFTKKNSKTKR